MASVAAASQLGTTALATQAYVLQFNTVILLAGFSMGLAAEILVGRLLGEGNLREAHGLVKRVTWMSLAISGAVSVVVALAGPWLVPLLTDDQTIHSEAIRLLWISVILETGLASDCRVRRLRTVGSVS